MHVCLCACLPAAGSGNGKVTTKFSNVILPVGNIGILVEASAAGCCNKLPFPSRGWLPLSCRLEGRQVVALQTTTLILA